MKQYFFYSLSVISIMLFPSEGLVGTYGGFTLSQTGYAVHTEISIGSHSDHSVEGPMFETHQQEAKSFFKSHSAVFKRIYDHYKLGSHQYKAGSSDLEIERTRERGDDYRFRYEIDDGALEKIIRGKQRPKKSLLSMFTSEIKIPSRIQVFIYLKAKIPLYRSNKILANFAASQLYSGGYLEDRERTQSPIANIDSYLAGFVPDTAISGESDFTSYIRYLFNSIPEHQVALQAIDFRKIEKIEIRIVGKIIRAVFSNQQFPKDLEADLLQIKDASEFVKFAGMIWVFSRDDEWPSWKSFLIKRSEQLKFPLEDYLK